MLYRFRLRVFGPRYQLGSRSNSRQRIEAPVRHHVEKHIQCHREGLYCASAEDDQRQPADRMFLVDMRPHEIDDCDVMSRLTSRARSAAEHEPERSFEHCFVSLLRQASSSKARILRAEASFLSALGRGSCRSVPSQPPAVLASSFGPTKCRLYQFVCFSYLTPE